MKKKILTYIYIVCCALVSALGYELFVFPNDFAPAGIGGICTMIQYLFNINVGYLTLLINIPLAIAVYILISKPMAMRAMVYTTAFSVFLVLFDYIDLSPFVYYTENGTSMILGPVIGGIVSGYVCSLMLRIGTHQAGVYFISNLVHRARPDFNFFWVSFALNAAVALASYFVYGFRIEPVLLSILYSFVTSLVNEKASQSTRSAVRFEIVTEHPEALSDAIINEIHHSATLLPGKGIYRGKETSVLICIVNKAQVPTLTAIIRSQPNTFAVMSQVSEVMGNFKRLDNRGKLPPKYLDEGDTAVV